MLAAPPLLAALLLLAALSGAAAPASAPPAPAPPPPPSPPSLLWSSSTAAAGSPPGPSARSGHASAAAGPYAFVLGGLDGGGAPLKDVFAFDSRPRSSGGGSGAWVAAQAFSPQAAPPPTFGACACYDNASATLALFGGATTRGRVVRRSPLLVPIGAAAALAAWAASASWTGTP